MMWVRRSRMTAVLLSAGCIVIATNDSAADANNQTNDCKNVPPNKATEHAFELRSMEITEVNSRFCPIARKQDSSMAARRKSVSRMLGKALILAILFAALFGGPIIKLIIISGRM